MDQISNSAVADTVASVFRGRDFTTHNTISIGQMIAAWLWNVVLHVFGFAASHPVVGLILRITLGILALVVLARIVYGLVVRYAPSAISRRHLDRTQGKDWWALAQSLAARDDYTDAAHALYMALISAASRSGLVSPHESKTTGDYLREIRHANGTIDVPRFTDFTRSYETVIYGIGRCDRDRFTRLNSLAGDLITGFSPRSMPHHAAGVPS